MTDDLIKRLSDFRLAWQESGDLTYLGTTLVDAIVEIERLRRAAPADGEAVARVTIEETGPVCKYFTEIDGRLQTLGLGIYDLYLATPPAARSEP